MSDLTITFQGTSAAVPSSKRGLSALTLQRGADLLLFDCGEGTQRQMMKSPVGFKAPSAVFITHGHGDHWFGLPGLLATLDMQEHDKPLAVYVPTRMLERVRNTLYHTGIKPEFLTLRDVGPESVVKFNTDTADAFSVTAFETDHCPGSVGYVFEEPERLGRFDPVIAQAAGIQPGPDFKRLQNGETVHGLRPEDVIGPARRGRKVVYTGDTAPQKQTCSAAMYADLLIHEATFENEERGRAVKTHHSTGGDAGWIAMGTPGLQRLALTHFSPRSRPKQVVQEAAEHFSPVQAATDGSQITIPLPA